MEDIDNLLQKILYKEDISKKEIATRMNYYITVAEFGMKMFCINDSCAYNIAKIIKKEIDLEYKFYKKNRELISDKPGIREYYAAIEDVPGHFSGPVTKLNSSAYLDEVRYYMEYWKVHSCIMK